MLEVLLSYSGDEVVIGSVDGGVNPDWASVTLDDIVADMRINHQDAAEITITIR